MKCQSCFLGKIRFKKNISKCHLLKIDAYHSLSNFSRQHIDLDPIYYKIRDIDESFIIFFFQATEFDISGKLSLLETICMQC